jgi:hypothetical protein
MTEPKAVIVVAEEPDAEVELSAQDLRGLADVCVSDERGCVPLEPLPKTTAPSASAFQMHAARSSARRDVPVSRISLSLLLVIGAIGTLYLFMASSDDARQPLTQNIPERASQSEWSEPDPEPEVEGEPVRFSNPFDAQEVFEFPAGTSEAKARDAVAQLLLERAVERQRQFDARVSKNDWPIWRRTALVQLPMNSEIANGAHYIDEALESVFQCIQQKQANGDLWSLRLTISVIVPCLCVSFHQWHSLELSSAQDFDLRIV